ncbi:MAG: hypothetical protein RL594_720 [Bacteroidota bacterium]|jgi:hypothetical protein
MNIAVTCRKAEAFLFEIRQWAGVMTLAGLLLSCRPAEIPVRPARIATIVQLEESDTTALSYVTQSRLVGDSMLFVLEYNVGDIQVFNATTGRFSRTIQIPSEVGYQLDDQFPDTIPACYLEVTGSGVKMNPLVTTPNEPANDYRRQRYSIRGFTTYSGDSLAVISGARVPYTLKDPRKYGRQTVLPYTFVYMTSLNATLGKAVVMSVSLSKNFVTEGDAIVACDSGFWVAAWDWYERDRFKNGMHPGPFVRSAKHSRDGRFIDILSRESPGYADSAGYRSGHHWLLEGGERGSCIRVISNVPAVDIMDAQDGTFTRYQLPNSVHSQSDSLTTMTIEPVRFGGRRLAVRVVRVTTDNTAAEKFIVIGDLDRSGRGLVWTSVVKLEQSDVLLSLISSNDSPLYRKHLLGIFENPERGPYLARIEVD